MNDAISRKSSRVRNCCMKFIQNNRKRKEWTKILYTYSVNMRDADLIERLSSSSSSSDEAEEDETVVNKPLPQKRLATSSALNSTTAGTEKDQVEYLYGQNFYEIRDACLKEEKLFEDPE